jgi:hypothetical protein
MNGRPSASEVADLKAMFEELLIRVDAVVQRAADIGLVLIGNAAGGDDVDVADDKRDAWVHGTGAQTDHQVHGRLYNPAGIVFRKPKKGETAHTLRARGHGGPGDVLVVPDGGDGGENHLPGWYGDNDAGLSGDETMHVESRKADVKIDADTANGKTVQIAGTSYAALKTDDFMTAFKAFVASLKTSVSVANVAAAATTLDATFTPAGDYKSTKVKHG